MEAVVFFNQEKAKEFEFRRKRGAHLFSKSRYLSAQLKRYVEGGLWLEMAEHANQMASLLATGLSSNNENPVAIDHNVDANMLFVTLSEKMITNLEEDGFLFYVMGKRSEGNVRLVTSWNTTESEVDRFLEVVKNSV